ncbi:MAG: hypothetical protein ACRDD8_03525 [Bacteroidales bacterium]
MNKFLDTNISGSLSVTNTITCSGDVIAYATGVKTMSAPPEYKASTMVYAEESNETVMNSPSAIDLLIIENNNLKRQMHFLYIEVQHLKEMVFK